MPNACLEKQYVVSSPNISGLSTNLVYADHPSEEYSLYCSSYVRLSSLRLYYRHISAKPTLLQDSGESAIV